MRTRFIVTAAALCALPLLWPAAPEAVPHAAQTQAVSADGKPAPALTGTWRSEPDEMKLTTEFDKSVWGPDATAVRIVELTVQSSGEARLVVTRRVTDAKGRTIAASTSTEEADIVIGAPIESGAVRREHEVKVVKAQRRYPDDPKSSWDLDGLGVKIVTFADGDANTLEVRFDTPEGRGSFWETLRRTGSGARKPS